MISLADIYNVLAAVIPLYVTMFLAYASVKWWKVFTPEQCSGINRFVATFAIPLLSFEFISRINPFKLNLHFIAADSLSKVLVLLVLFSLANLSPWGSLDWSITLFSLTTLPNTIVVGIPLIKSMYGADQEGLMVQMVVLQSVIWYTLLLFLFEYRAARSLVMEGAGGSERTDAEEGDEVVHVIVARPSLEREQQRVQQMGSKVAPDSGDKRLEEEEEECGSKELHMFVWKCACCVSSDGLCEKSVKVCSTEEDRRRAEDEQKEISGVGFMLIMKMVLLKLVTNPNSYASLLGLTWALVSGRWGIKKPKILENSVTMLSNAGLGMAMFSLGLFMALQPRIIACGNKQAVVGMVMRFAVGPAVMALASLAVSIRGTVLKVAIVQAALPQGIVPFVFAREYNLHPEVLSTALIFGMMVSLPVTILYYVLLGL
ncbi:auxin efflux carrier component 7-like [Iris pallida]|uniref:Auxin efflux carrier component n=1 Tax=Iris pallida TaxID=29817 RepID=A0AAX6GPP7_IRIPA|nr:auxin efflux carrier component 7-like [Iris pallida]